MNPTALALGMTPEQAEEARKEYEGGNPYALRIAEAAQKGHENQVHEAETNPYYRDPYKEIERKEKRAVRRTKLAEEGKRDWKENTNFQPLLMAWMERHGTSSAAVEAKVTTGLSIPWDHLQPHQKDNLLRVKHGKLVHKISDLANSVGFKTRLPFDLFILTGAKAFIAVQFDCQRRGNFEFVLIDVDDWCAEEKASNRASLTFERAKIIGRVFNLKV